MPELTDDQLDGLFRKSAEEFDPPFDPAAWQDMKARLDTNDYTTPIGAFTWKNILRWGLPVVLLLLLTGGGWYVYQKANTTKSIAVTPIATGPKAEVHGLNTDQNTTAKGSNQTESSRVNKLTNTKQSNDKLVGSGELKRNEDQKSADRATAMNEPAPKSSQPANGFDKSTERPTAATAPEAEAATKPVSSAYKLTSGKLASGRNRGNRLSLAVAPWAGNKAKTTANRLERTAYLKTRQPLRRQRKPFSNREQVAIVGATDAVMPTSSFRKRKVVREQDVVQSNVFAAGGDVISPEPNEATALTMPTLNEIALRPTKWPVVSFPYPPVVAHPDTTTHSVVPSVPFQRGLSVRFAIAPDLSSVGLHNFSRPGTNVGAFLEYRFASRWSIQTGMIQSTKVYRALPSEYTAPYGVWGGKVPPENIDGRCNMFDIPINLRYDVIVKANTDRKLVNRWFVSAGVTSYIMKQEDYIYNYPPHTYGQLPGFNTSTGGYRFSNLNLSVGYERAFSRRLSWQIEPFIKAPLKGVGLFKIDLLSTGVFFSIRLKL